MRKILIVCLLCLSALYTAAEDLVNLYASQEGKKIVLSYDLNRDVYISSVSMILNGHPCIIPNQYLQGDIDKIVPAGNGRRIEYEVLNHHTSGLVSTVSFFIEYVSHMNVVVETTHYSEKIYAKKSNEQGYTYRSNGTWDAFNLEVGTYYIKRTREHWEDQYDTIQVVPSTTRITLSKMQPKMGRLTVTSTPRRASVTIDGNNMGSTPWTGAMQIGFHTVSVNKSGRIKPEDHTVSVAYNKHTKTHFHLGSEWINGSDYHPDHYLEPMYGYDFFHKRGHYAGIRYGWIPKRFGLDISALYGINSGELSATLGPTLRLTNFSSPLSLQLALGGGAMYRPSDGYLTWVADAALRFGFEENLEDFAWWSFSLGARYYDGRAIPTASISLMPVRALTLLAIEEEDFPCIYVEATGGYEFNNAEWMLGAQFGYIPSHLGVGTGFMVGLDGSWDVTAGPIFRFTTDDIPFDLHLYQGVGYGSFDSNGVVGETSLRFAFGYKNPYLGLWSFSVGCVYGQGCTAVTCGISLPLAAVAAGAGLVAIGCLFL